MEVNETDIHRETADTSDAYTRHLKLKLNHWDPYPKPPTRRRTPYAYFIQEYYRRYRRYLRTRDPRMIHHNLHQHWELYLTAEEKVRYEDMGKKDRKRYQDEWAAYKANFKGKRVPRVRRKRKNPLKSKQTRNAYIFYQREVLPIIRQENPGVKYVELIKIIGVSWRNLSRAEREPYRLQSAEDKARYCREKLQFRQEREKRLYENAQHRQVIRLALLKKRQIREKLGFVSENTEDELAWL